jgi:hypothetical protein
MALLVAVSVLFPSVEKPHPANRVDIWACKLLNTTPGEWRRMRMQSSEERKFWSGV